MMFYTKTILSLLLVGITSICLAHTAFADTSVFVSDDNSPENPHTRWIEFATTVSATIDSPPESDMETTISGPSYSWSIISQSPSNPTITINQSNDASTTLQSPRPTMSVNLAGGFYYLEVGCTVTYTSTDNKTGVQTPLVFSGTGPVDFLVLMPSNVIKNGPKTAKPLPSGVVGHDDAYQLRIMDNQLTPQPYANGLAHETFNNITGPDCKPANYTLINQGGPYTWGLNIDNQGFATGPGFPASDFTDDWSIELNANTYNSTFPNGIPDDTVFDNFDQPWYCLELTPTDPGQPYNTNYVIAGQFKIDIDRTTSDEIHNNPQLGQFQSNVNQTQLSGGAGSTHHAQDEFKQSLRSYPGQPAY